MLYFIISLLVLTLIVIGILVWDKRITRKNRVIKRGASSPLKELLNFVDRYPWLTAIVRKTAISLNKVNGLSLENNTIIAVFMTIGYALVMYITFLVYFYNVDLWYMAVLYILMTYAVFWIFLRMAYTGMEMYFSTKLPLAFKLISSRYAGSGRILESMEKTLPDVHPAVRKVLKRITEILSINENVKMDIEFRRLENTFNNEYVTIFAMLVRKAYYKGEVGVIKDQLRLLSDDVMNDVENRQDVMQAGRGFVYLGIVTFPLALWGIEAFSYKMLEGYLTYFYDSPEGSIMKVLTLLAAMVMVIVLHYMESIEPTDEESAK